MLLWQWNLSALGRVGVAAAFIYAACGALRLARFNVSTAAVGKRFFIGLPIPAAGCTVVTFVFCAAHFPDIMSAVLPYMALVLAVGVGVLMVSRVRYFSFKEYDFLRAHPIRTMNYKGKAHKVGEHIDTDAIIPARFLVTTDAKKLGEQCMSAGLISAQPW